MLVQARWWDAVMAAGLLACGILLGASTPFNRSPVGWAALAGVALVYLLLARRQFAREDGPVTLPLAACGVLTAVFVGVGVFSYPALATLQCVAYPLVWTLPWRLRPAIAANLAIAVAVFLGYGLSPVIGYGAWLEGAAVAALSLVFSLALGIWISRIAAYGAERARLLGELTAAQDELAAMHREAGETSERARFARELHDTVTQSLTGVVMLAERAGAQLRAGAATDAAASVALVESAAREALGEARALVATMTPVAADSGLAEALRRLGARFQRETGIGVEIHAAERHLPRDREVVLLRCAQEGLANVRKHARASHVVVDVTADEAGGQLALVVRDDGVGVDSSTAVDDSGFGIAGMRERVGMLGGRLTLGNAAHGGVELAITIPLGAA
jgi:signal transduction histidine kinase